jgi:peroxiredoxin
MHSTNHRFHPLLYIIVGMLVGGGFGFIIFWGFPSGELDSASQAELDEGGVQQDTITLTSSDSAQFGMKIGALAPDFLLEDVAGEEYQLSDYRGKVVLLNFWATWCGPCLVEMPLLQSEYQAYKGDGLLVMAINNGESHDIVTAFGDENDLTFPLLLDPGSVVQRLYEIHGYPSSVFIDKEGHIRLVHIGLLQKRQLAGYLDELGFGS